MSKQGAPPQHRPEDAWWHAVYTGPAATLPDTPGAVSDEGSVDDWFASAAGMIGAQRTGPTVEPDTTIEPDEPGKPGEAVDVANVAEVSVDDWFDSAADMIGAQRTEEPQAPPTPVEAAPAPPPTSTSTPPPPPPPPPAPQSPPPQTPRPSTRRQDTPPVPHVGERPPTYGPEPTALPAADPDELATVVPDTALEGAQYGVTTLRAASVRGDSARYRGEPRRDALLVTRFGDGPDGLLLAVLGAPSRSRPPSSAAAEAARQLTAAVGRSRPELAADLRDGARDRLRYGLQRLAARAASPLRTVADDDPPPDLPAPDAGSLHCLLISLDPAATHRAAFGVGPGGLYLLRSGHWIDAYAARLLHHPDGEPPIPASATAVPRPFRFRLVPAIPGDILLLCTPGLAEPIVGEPAVAHFLSTHWVNPHPPGTVDFLRHVQVRAKGYADDRTAVALWTE